MSLTMTLVRQRRELDRLRRLRRPTDKTRAKIRHLSHAIEHRKWMIKEVILNG